jgi:hypothetical protein
VLEQNVKLRAAIAAEEREKFASEKEGYLQAALEEERRTMANQVTNTTISITITISRHRVFVQYMV